MSSFAEMASRCVLTMEGEANESPFSSWDVGAIAFYEDVPLSAAWSLATETLLLVVDVVEVLA